MDTRKTIFIYQFSERIKSELIIASQLLTKMETLKNDEFIGGMKMMCTYLEALTGEIKIAQSVEKSVNFLGAERKVREAIGKIKLNERTGIDRCISDALSLITTSCQVSMEALITENLI